MKKTVLFPVILILAACHKNEKPTPEDNRQYSHWVVNEDSFSTNHVETAIGKARVDLYAEGFENSFSISFDIGYDLPSYGAYPLAKVQTNDPSFAHIGFYYYSLTYIPAPSSNSYLIASSVNGKARYALSPTWFINYYDHSDSVLISGTFNEP